ncbi:methionine ABC transporter substrate-binding protein [Klebsiella michiganensis]|uniref:Methionine ABC transporter substrate-binding protein n=1 Tax=Klebsiella michiganensis TaxID=1134687 RepID=A0A7H4MYW0_9ENTR|nr:methionine ABC transporter substrate-binding protein [Klebsiella michiganensis]
MPHLNWQGLHCLSSLAWSSAQAAALRVAADPVPHAEILNYIKKIDPSLDLKIVELTSGVNANELLANGDVDANYFQHVPYLKDQEKALGKNLRRRGDRPY